MNGIQILLLSVVAAFVTGHAILVVRRARRTLWFEILLWLGTLLVPFLGAFIAIAGASEFTALRGLGGLTIQDIPLIPATLGAFGGALALTLPLLLMSRFEKQDAREWDRESPRQSKKEQIKKPRL